MMGCKVMHQGNKCPLGRASVVRLHMANALAGIRSGKTLGGPCGQKVWGFLICQMGL